MKKFKHKLLKPIELVAKEIGGKRFYTTPEGNAYPSVTTVINYKKKVFFAEWRKNNPKEAKRVTVRGNKFHSCVESYLLNEHEENGDNFPSFAEKFLFQQLQPELDKIDNVRILEGTLWSDMLMMAGRVDCVADYDGKLSIIDFKTSGKEKKKEYIEEYFQQATAYSIMLKERHDISCKNIVILVTSEDGTTQVFQENPKYWVPKLKETIEYYWSQIENATILPGNR